ncbi:hypothetical protein K0M31_011978 [Melipona bicolor]|uniref:Uncharacterized protein n=1 Tax=Melipona bicolor TaxID=60889 RepID=A0AA40KV96_9HYME|nr:hypothetical protein K0M31_011978 [Melipona bicolor]
MVVPETNVVNWILNRILCGGIGRRPVEPWKNRRRLRPPPYSVRHLSCGKKRRESRSSLEGEGLSGAGAGPGRSGNFRAGSKVQRARSDKVTRSREQRRSSLRRCFQRKRKEGEADGIGGSVAPPRLYNFGKFLLENSARPGALRPSSFVKFDADATRAPDGRECASGGRVRGRGILRRA